MVYFVERASEQRAREILDAHAAEYVASVRALPVDCGRIYRDAPGSSAGGGAASPWALGQNVTKSALSKNGPSLILTKRPDAICVHGSGASVMERLVLSLVGKPFALELNTGLNRRGRNATKDFRIADASISSFHCEIVLAPDNTVHVRDLASTNGTYICLN